MTKNPSRSPEIHGTKTPRQATAKDQTGTSVPPPTTPKLSCPANVLTLMSQVWTQKSDPRFPLLANAFSETPGVYTDDKSRKGGIFKGESCAWVTVGGSAKVSELSAHFRVLETKDGKKTDVFSKAWATNPANIKNPEG
jgi:hypothetical protein